MVPMRPLPAPALFLGVAWLLGCGDNSSATGGAGGAGTGADTTSMSTSSGGATAGGGGSGAGIVGVDPGSPVVFYTDLVTAPPGAYVTLWGNGFGASQGAGSVTLAGAATTIVSWGARKIEVRLPANATGGDLVVTTDGGASPPVAFGVHTGTLYFVSPSGDDAASGTAETPNGADGPFQTLPFAVDQLLPGDVLYVRAGSYTGEDDFNAVVSLYDVATGTADQPVAIVGYPSETATIGDGTLARGLSLYRGDAAPSFDWLVLAKLKFLPSCDAVELIGADHGRFVGNEVSGASDACLNGVLEAQGSSGWRVLGNFLHDNGNTKLEHGIYLGGYGSQSDWEIGWNRIQNQAGGRAIQLYGHQPGDAISDVWIHDNEIVDIDRDGVVLGATDADVLTLTNIRIENNVFLRAGRCVGSGVRVNNDTASGVTVAFNTFVDNGGGTAPCDQSAGEVQGQLLLEAAAAVDASSNLLLAAGAESYVDEQTAAGVLTGSHNLFFGAGAAPAFDAAAVAADPLLVDVASGDLHLSPGSPAIDAAFGDLPSDHDGVARPQGAGPDIGAYEWFAP